MNCRRGGWLSPRTNRKSYEQVKEVCRRSANDLGTDAHAFPRCNVQITANFCIFFRLARAKTYAAPTNIHCRIPHLPSTNSLVFKINFRLTKVVFATIIVHKLSCTIKVDYCAIAELSFSYLFAHCSRLSRCIWPFCSLYKNNVIFRHNLSGTYTY